MPEFIDVFSPLTNDKILKIKNTLLNKTVQVKVDTNKTDYRGWDINSIYVDDNKDNPIPAHIYLNGILLDNNFFIN